MAGGDADAVAVRDGTIAYVGSAAGAREHVGPGTEVVDLAGRMLMPGIHDAHLHPLAGGVVLTRPTLDYARLDKAAFLDAMRGLIARDGDRPGDAWMAVDLWDATAMDEQPTRADLDALPTERPILVVALDGHIAVANSRALALAGVAAGTDDPPGGVITRDPGGEPTGILHDAAIALLEAQMPTQSAEQDADALRAAHEALVAAGVTSYMDASAFAPELAAVAALSDRGGLLVRCSSALTIQPEEAEDPAAMLAHLERLREEHGRPDITLRTAKFFLDGVIEHPTQTAAMLEPYLVEEDGRRVPGPSRGARLGLLMQRQGMWGERRLLDAAWLSESRKPCPINPQYGLLWWLNTGRVQFPGAPETAFAARGAGSNVIFIDPDRDLVAVVRWIDRASLPGFVHLLMESIAGA